MTILSGLSALEKGQQGTATLDKAGLFALAPIAADPYFSVQSNVDKALFFYKATNSTQKEILIFDLSQAQPEAIASFSETALNDWEIEKIILTDFDGGSFIVQNGDLPTDIQIQLPNLVTFTETISGVSKINAVVRTSAIQSDGKILLGGDFTNYGGTIGRNKLIRLNADGTLDTAFCVNAVDGYKFSNIVWAIAVQSDGKILVGGDFTNYGFTSGRGRLIRLNADGTLDLDTSTPNGQHFHTNAVDATKFNNTVYSIAVQSDGKILVGGNFSNYAGTTNRNRLIRLNAHGTLDLDTNTPNTAHFHTNAVDAAKFSNTVWTIAVQSDGKILVGGSFSNYAGTTNRSYLIRLNAHGTLDLDTNTPNTAHFHTNAVDAAKFNNTVYSIAVQSDGKILVGGDFSSYASTSGRNRLVRLNAHGTLDTSFCANASDSFKINNIVFSIAVQSDGKILVGGDFTNYSFVSNRNRLIKLNADGSLNTAFCANASDGDKFNAIVYSIKVRSDDSLAVSGFFNGGYDKNTRFTIINSDGTFNQTTLEISGIGAKVPVGTILAIAVQSDGKILVGGAFQRYGGVLNRNYLVRLNADGTLDTAFCTNAVDGAKFSNTVWAIAVQSDGKILVGGSFTSYGTAGRNYLIRLNSTGTLDLDTSTPNSQHFHTNAVDGAKFNNTVYSIAVQSDGKILVGGDFINYAGTTNRNRLIRLNAHGTLDLDTNTSNSQHFHTNAVDATKFNNTVYSIAVQSDGKILVGGAFSSYAGTTNRSYLIRLNAHGTLDLDTSTPNSQHFHTNAVDAAKFGAIIRTVYVQSDGTILVGGDFFHYGGTTGRSKVVKLNAHGTLDTSFCANAVDGSKLNGSIYIAKPQLDGKILIGGGLINYAGVTGRNYLVRLNADGTLDTAFCTSAIDVGKFNNPPYTAVDQLDGKLFIGGEFTTYAGKYDRLIVLKNGQIF